MAKRKRSVGELISSLVFFFMGLWLIREGQYLFSGGEVFKGLIVILGAHYLSSCLSLPNTKIIW